MKRLLFIAFLLLFTQLSFSQSRLIKTGEFIEYKDQYPFWENINLGESTLYVYQNALGFKIYIEKIDNTTLNRIYSKEILSFKERDLDALTGGFIKNKKLHLLSKEYNSINKTTDYILNIISLDNPEVLKKETILEFPTKNKNSFLDHSMRLVLNPDSTKIAFIFENHADGNQDIVFEYREAESLKIIGQNKLNFQYKEKELYGDYKLDDQNNIYLLRYYNFSSNAYNNVELISTNLLSNKHISKYELSSPALTKLSNVHYSIIPGSKIALVYAAIEEVPQNPKDNEFKNKGFIMFKLQSNDLKEISKKINYFDKEIISKLTCDLPKNLPMSNYFLSLHYYDDNNIILNMDSENKLYTYNTNSSYYLLVFSLSLDLNVNWSRFIYRNIVGVSPLVRSPSTTVIINKESISYMFLEHEKFENDHIDYKNVNLCGFRKPADSYTLKETNIVLYTLGLNGVLSRKVLLSNSGLGIYPPDKLIKNSPESIVVKMLNDKKEGYGLLNIK